PVSVCSESCPPGSRKAALRGQPVCCFDCIPCSEGEIANHTDSTECLHCPEGSWSNKQRDSCIPKVVEFLSYTEPLGAVLASLSVLTSLLPASTLALFLWHHHTPIVKANNRQLSYVLLCALALCPLCSLIFIGQPSPASCMLRQTAFGIIFALSVSCVLAKTVLVVIAFKASIPGSSLHRWMNMNRLSSLQRDQPVKPMDSALFWIEYVMRNKGGFQCKPAKPLPQDLEEFMESSGEHGVVVMSLGTLVNGLPSELTDKIAYAFSQLPQKVIWRHLGERPSSLGNNTLLVKWLPQNDLLGHPKTRAFVTHGGTNGVYEAIYHGVPIVGLPLLFDQFDNLLRMQVRGAAKVLEVTTLGSKDFLQALKEVLEEPSYQMNMNRLSSLQRDQPIKPMDSALFWIEYVMRNKGAAHLRTESYRMPWYAYYCVDVIVVLLAAVLVFMAAIIGIVRFMCCRVCKKRKIKHE
ncbi:UDP-glucuronosyltransferase 2B20, partial [Acipenser ruthenus]